MKTAQEYLAYCTEHEEERGTIKNLFGEAFDRHIEGLGFRFTREELNAEIEKAVEVLEKDLAGVVGGQDGGWLLGKDGGWLLGKDGGWLLDKDGKQCIGSCW